MKSFLKSILTNYLAVASLWLGIGSAASGNLWIGGGGDNLWSNIDNWSQQVVPINAFADPRFGFDDPAGPFYPLTPSTDDDGPIGNNDVKLQENGTVTLIDDSVGIASAFGVRVGNGGATNTLMISGGRLDIGIDPNVDPSANAVGWHLQVGRGYPGFDGGPTDPNPKATVIMSGGEVNTNGVLIPEQFVNHNLEDPTDSEPLNGELIMSGGVINARWMNLGQLKGNGSAELSGDAVINIKSNVANDPSNGGHLSFNRNWFLNGLPVPSSGNVSLDIRDNAIINIYGHLSGLIQSPDVSEVTRYQSHVDAGELTADSGADEPTIFLDDTIGLLKICALDADFDSDCDTDDDDLLAWQTGYGMTGTPGDLTTFGDADNDGDVDGADFLEFQIEYGTGVSDDAQPLLGTVPEPSSLVLACCATMTVGGRRRLINAQSLTSSRSTHTG